MFFLGEVGISTHYSGNLGGGLGIYHKMNPPRKNDWLLGIELNRTVLPYFYHSHTSSESGYVRLDYASLMIIHRRNYFKAKRFFISQRVSIDRYIRAISKITIISWEPGSYKQVSEAVSNDTYALNRPAVLLFAFGTGYKVPVKKSKLIVTADFNVSLKRVFWYDAAYNTFLRLSFTYTIPALGNRK